MGFIKRMGGNTVVVAELGGAVHQRPVPPIANKPVFDRRRSGRAMTDGLNELGRMAAENDMTLCYHHHMGTGVMTRAETDRLMAETDPEVVHLLLDTGHLYWAGDDPLDMARAYADRIRHVHLKDIRQDVMDSCNRRHLTFIEVVIEGVFTVPGDGVIDFAPIFEALAEAGYEGWLMVEAEQDARQGEPARLRPQGPRLHPRHGGHLTCAIASSKTSAAGASSCWCSTRARRSVDLDHPLRRPNWT